MKEYKITEFQFNELRKHLEVYEKLKHLTYDICDDMLNAKEDELNPEWRWLFCIDREEYDYDTRNFKFLLDDIEALN